MTTFNSYTSWGKSESIRNRISFEGGVIASADIVKLVDKANVGNSQFLGAQSIKIGHDERPVLQIQTKMGIYEENLPCGCAHTWTTYTDIASELKGYFSKRCSIHQLKLITQACGCQTRHFPEKDAYGKPRGSSDHNELTPVMAKYCPQHAKFYTMSCGCVIDNEFYSTDMYIATNFISRCITHKNVYTNGISYTSGRVFGKRSYSGMGYDTPSCSSVQASFVRALPSLLLKDITH